MIPETLSHRDYLILRTAAQKLKEKYECDLRQCPESMRTKSLESIIDLDFVISQCNRSDCSFTEDECKLLIAAVVNYRGILPQSSINTHIAIPLLLEKLADLLMPMYAKKEPLAYNNAIRESILMNV